MDKIAHLITSVPIDIVVGTTFPNESAGPLLDTLVAISEGRMQTLGKEGFASPKLGFVYVSGTWVRQLKSPPRPLPNLFHALSLLESPGNSPPFR